MDHAFRLLGAALAVLLVNLFWNDPLREASGGGALAFVAFNLAPSAAALAWLMFGGTRRRQGQREMERGPDAG